MQPSEKSKELSLADFSRATPVDQLKPERFFIVKDDQGHLGVFHQDPDGAISGKMIIDCMPATAITLTYPNEPSKGNFWLVVDEGKAIRLFHSPNMGDSAKELIVVDAAEGWKVQKVLSADLLLIFRRVPGEALTEKDYAIQSVMDGVMSIDVPKGSRLHDMYAGDDGQGSLLVFTRQKAPVDDAVDHLASAIIKVEPKSGLQHRIM